MDEKIKPDLKSFILYIFIILLAVIGVIFLFSKDNTAKKDISSNISTDSAQIKYKTYTSEPEMKIDEKKKYSANIQTNKGAIEVELFVKENPKTVNNFIFLARDGFYNSSVFHRIIKGFMMQGGDPKGDGTGGPGYKFADEKITRDYKRGIVAMANSGPNTNGSQFFIMHKDNNLPKSYVIFGQVTKGIETVDKIAETPTVDNGLGELSKPAEKVTLDKVEISEN